MKPVFVHTGATPFVTEATDGTHHWIIDEPVDKGGVDKGPDPLSLLLSSLGSCTAITLNMYARRKGWNVRAIDIKLSLVSTEIDGQKHSVVLTEITVTGALEEFQLQRLTQIAKACPVSKLLEGKIVSQINLQTKSDEHSTTR